MCGIDDMPEPLKAQDTFPGAAADVPSFSVGSYHTDRIGSTTVAFRISGRQLCHTFPQGSAKKMPRSRPPIGAKSQVTGAIAILIGIYLRIFGPQPVEGLPMNPHYLAWTVLGVGISLLVGGTLIRIFLHRPLN
jgi:hypothetical protein